MGFKCGIVGLPNVGKSTLFNALTKASCAAENYPFCTIDPNLGMVPVPDSRLNNLAEIVKPQKIIPATMQFVDIAGLVAGAAHGEGLGNQFLAHIRETDAIAQVVRCFDHPDVIHVAGQVDPLRDCEIIQTELALADLATVERALERVQRVIKTGEKAALARKNILEQIRTQLDQARPVRTLNLDENTRNEIRDLFLLTAKPMLYIANVTENDLLTNRFLPALTALAESEQTEVVPICAALEAALGDLEDCERQALLAELALKEPGLNRLVQAGYRLLGLATYFTAGPKEVRAWTIPQRAKAPQAAGVIHSDFEKGFIRAEVIDYKDFIVYRGEQGAKEAGRLRVEGKEYVVQDGDVMHFRFNT